MGKVTGCQDCFDGGCGEETHGTGRHVVEPWQVTRKVPDLPIQLAKGP